MTYEQLAKIAEESGFSAWAELDVSTIELKPEVRDMCAANTCGQYGKRWSCPPRLRHPGGMRRTLKGLHPWYPGADLWRSGGQLRF